MTDTVRTLQRHIKGTLVFGLLIVIAALSPIVSQAEKVVPDHPSQVEYSYAPLIKKVAPAVVNIYTRRTIRQSRRSPFAGSIFEQFFGEGFASPPQGQSVQNSLGSGVIVGKDGVVVTNRHVIAGADEITVALSDRREFEAELILEDERSDLAVLRINTGGEELPALAFRNSDGVEVGDIVFAIGNPFGVGQTVTSGIVSGVSVSDIGISHYESFIQTDAAINPGNSGGALVGLDGTLFGINTVIISRSGGSQGVGFAIPANLVSRVVESALTDGKIVRPWFGAAGQTVTSDIAESLGLDRPMGVMVNTVYEDGPADRGGVEIGDIILNLRGHDVTDPKNLASRLAAQPVGGTVAVSILRGGEHITLQVPLEASPEDPPANRTALSKDHPMGGATVANLSPALAEELGLDMMAEGVIVLEVVRGSRAGQFSLRPGDKIAEVNGNTLDSVARLDAYWGTYDGEIYITVLRRGRSLRARIQ
jgi:Do/DeqQ family serine protease